MLQSKQPENLEQDKQARDLQTNISHASKWNVQLFCMMVV